MNILPIRLRKMPWGIDVSHYQSGPLPGGRIDWKAVRKSGCAFAFIKASQGNSIDPDFATNWQGAGKYGPAVRGAYHYAMLTSSAEQTAATYVNAVRKAGGFRAGDFAILDAEDVTPDSKNLSPVATAQWCVRWCNEVARLTGLSKSRIIVYTGMWWWIPRTRNSTALNDHPLWVSGYTIRPPKVTAWRTWRFWQYTNKRKVPGITAPCDASIFNGNLAALHRIAGLTP